MHSKGRNTKYIVSSNVNELPTSLNVGFFKIFTKITKCKLIQINQMRIDWESLQHSINAFDVYLCGGLGNEFYLLHLALYAIVMGFLLVKRVFQSLSFMIYSIFCVCACVLCDLKFHLTLLLKAECKQTLRLYIFSLLIRKHNKTKELLYCICSIYLWHTISSFPL